MQQRHHIGHFRAGVAARQGAAQRAEQALALAPGGVFYGRGPLAPGLGCPGARRQQGHRLGHKLGILGVDQRLCPVREQRPPLGKIGLHGDVVLGHGPEPFGLVIGHAQCADLPGHRGIGQRLVVGARQREQIVGIKLRRRCPERGQIKAVDQILH